jgi:general secretion pathway protein F
LAVYAYIAIDRDQTRAEGTVIADTPRQARDDLRDRGLTIQSLSPREIAKNAVGLRRLLGRRHKQDVLMLIRELATLVGVGLPLLEALDTIIRQLKGRRHAAFRQVTMALRDRVTGGTSLADAMREQPMIFDEMCINLVEVGENSGHLDEALEQLADFRQRAAQFRGRITAALMYPAIVLTAGVAVTVFLMTFVTPSLLASLIEADRPLPLVTRIVKAVSDSLVHGWWLILLVLISAVATAVWVLSTTWGRRKRDALVLRIPVIGELVRKQAVVRIAVVVATLMRSGVVFLQALEVAERATQNSVLKDALSRAREAVHSGREIGEALDASNAFPPTVVQIFDVGQQSGRLEAMLERLATDYDQQGAALSGRLASLLEPILILVLAMLVGFIAFATILPILEAGNVL